MKKIYYANAYETINHSKLNIINVRSTTIFYKKKKNLLQSVTNRI